MIRRAVAFYLLAFVFTVVLGGVQEGASISTATVILPQWGPGLAALAMLGLFRRDHHRFWVLDRSIPASRYAAVALIPTGGALAVYLINTLVLGAVPFSNAERVPWLMMLWMPLGAFGEELGWRGYLHQRLSTPLRGLTSSIIVGVMWALWHVGLYRNGVVYMGLIVLLLVSYSVVIYVLIQATGFNVLLAAIFHLMINVTNLFSFSSINETSFIAANASVWAAIALTVVVVTRKSVTPHREAASPRAA